MPSVPVIAVGAIAFAVGQTYVTLSFRRGFSTGWAIGGSPGESRRRRSSGDRDTRREPTLEVSDLEVEYDRAGEDEAEIAAPAPAAAVYEPEPLPDDTGQYGIYTDPVPQQRVPAGSGAAPVRRVRPVHRLLHVQRRARPGQLRRAGRVRRPERVRRPGQYAGQDTYAGPGRLRRAVRLRHGPAAVRRVLRPVHRHHRRPLAVRRARRLRELRQLRQPAAVRATPTPQQYTTETPPGGVWVPQQREGEQYPPEQQPAQPAPYPNAYDSGYNEQQYRY